MFSNGGHLGFFNHHEKKNSLPVIQHLTLTLDTVHLSQPILPQPTNIQPSPIIPIQPARILPAPQHVSLVSTAVTNVVSSVVKLEPQTVNKSQSASTSPLRVPQQLSIPYIFFYI
jgi:hypothetical protein